MLPILILLILSFAWSTEKLYVVQRERSSLAVVQNGKLVKTVENLGNLNHATLKFRGRFAYIISRDGILSKIDTGTDSLVKKAKVGKSGIGFTFCGAKVAVANYEPDTVVLLSEDLDVEKEIKTASRNVGIKSWKGLLVFSLMDRDSVWMVNCSSGKVIKRVEKVGNMPFDALLSEGRYIVGFFKERGVGILDLEGFRYKKVNFKEGGREITFKIPHFGLWGVWKDTAYIPSVGSREIKVVNLKSFSYLGSIKLPGLPVFVAVSPEGKYLAVNYSGDKENYLSLVDRERGKVIRTSELGKRIMHFRFSPDGRFIYLSSYYENLLKKVRVPDLSVVGKVRVATPSGVFLYKGGN